jgi:hypothetical protein
MNGFTAQNESARCARNRSDGCKMMAFLLAIRGLQTGMPSLNGNHGAEAVDKKTSALHASIHLLSSQHTREVPCTVCVKNKTLSPSQLQAQCSDQPPQPYHRYAQRKRTS